MPRYRRQFVALFRRNPGAVIGVNAANELINLGAGLGVRYAALLAPVALVSAISSTTTFFVFVFGILLTLFFPRLGREDLSAGNLIQKGRRRASHRRRRDPDRNPDKKVPCLFRDRGQDCTQGSIRKSVIEADADAVLTADRVVNVFADRGEIIGGLAARLGRWEYSAAAHW